MTTDRTALEAARDALPPLPASHYVPDTDPAFTADQMRDYAAQAVTAALSSPPVLPAEPVAYRDPYPESQSALADELRKAREDERLFGVSFTVNGWHVPARLVAMFGAPIATPATPAGDGRLPQPVIDVLVQAKMALAAAGSMAAGVTIQRIDALMNQDPVTVPAAPAGDARDAAYKRFDERAEQTKREVFAAREARGEWVPDAWKGTK